MRGIARLLADAWRLASPYYRSEQRWTARLLLVSVIGLNLILVGFTVLLNFWNGEFYDSLQNKDLNGFIKLLLSYRWDEKGFMPGFVPIVSIYVPLAIMRSYLTQFLSIRWRQWMTNRMLSDWLSDRAYYTIGLTTGVADKGTDNPDQRIAEDIRDFAENSLVLGIGFLSKTVSLFNFSLILWSLSGPMTLLGVSIPGYMLWSAIIYALAGTWLTHLVGRPLVPLNFAQQKAEADFRFALVRFRENTEGVALSGGEAQEKSVLTGRFGEVARNWFRIMNRELKLNALILGYEQAAVVFPIILAAPRYFAGEIALGGMMRTVGAFSRVQDALSWFVVSYAELAKWRATVVRLTGFQAALATAHALAGRGISVQDGGGAISLQDATVLLPDGTVLLDHPSFALEPGRSTAISGRSGSGKSTLFRAIAGIWPFGSGTIRRPAGRYLFLPQRPYIPLGTLRQAVTYPAAPGAYGKEAVTEALDLAGLGQLAPRLDEDHTWGQSLSGGEQQRLAVARALLLRPDWLFMDEATASLDPEAEAELYATIRKHLPDTTVISIAHAVNVAGYHDGTLVFRRQPGSPGTLSPRQAETMASTALP